MNEHQKENALKIAAYLQNRLSPEEREAFKRLLSEDDELRVQYVDALMNRAGTGEHAGGEEGGGSVVAGGGEAGGGEVEGGEVEGGAAESGAVLEEKADAGETSAPNGGETGDAEVHEADAEEAHEADAEEAGETHAAGAGELEEGTGEATVGGREDWESLGEQGAREAWEAGWPGGKKKAKGGFLGSRWMVGITVLVLLIAGIVVYTISQHQATWAKIVAAITSTKSNADKRARMDSAAVGADSAQAGAAGSAQAGSGNAQAGGQGSGANAAAGGGGSGVTSGNGKSADSAYSRLYKPYMRGDDPVEVRKYYEDYRKGNYGAVIATGDSVRLGVGQRAVLIRDYMRLYVGLSDLATGDARNAVTELEAVVRRTKPGDILYETAQWYLALAWLKRNDVGPEEAVKNSLGLAREISRGYSRYATSAGELVRALRS